MTKKNMKAAIDILNEKVSATMIEVTGLADCNPAITPATDPRFGDYQANGVMVTAKILKTNPRKLAEQIVEKLDVSDICLPAEIAGPGFINFRLKTDFLADTLLQMNTDLDHHLRFSKPDKPQTIIVDFSSPNIAKQMHVGHLRSTIIGDGICRMLQFLGHNVIRQNHIGDWGAQFGMLIAYLRQQYPEILQNPESAKITDLEQFYRNAKARCDQDPDFAAAARVEVTNLHKKNNETMLVWQHIVDESRKHYQPIYEMLSVGLDKKNERGESFYADKLADVVTDLQKVGLAIESEGAICVFPAGFKNKDGQDLPLIVCKSDGAFLYATTDLAAIRYRADELKADKIIYVTDARQKLHFEMVFAVARQAHWAKENLQLQHVTFGTVLGEDGTPLKTRSGENIKLRDLLIEAIDRARQIVQQKNPELDDRQKEQIAKAIGIGAVKYADYSNNRTSDYVFSFDKMLAMEGNTAPYMQYAYARIKSIERKAQLKDIDVAGQLSNIKKLLLTEPAELDLAKQIAQYSQAIKAAADDCRPNYLTSYLYELAQKFSAFYSACPVLAGEPDRLAGRLLLCHLTAQTIKHGLNDLLGIQVVDQM